MRTFKTEQIRNVGLFSHGGAGKTSLTEAILFNSKGINRLGRVEDGTTVSDFDPDEIKRHISVSTSLVPAEWNDCKLNLLDAPGFSDFVGEIKSAMRVADCALIVMDATGGVEVGTEQVWNDASKREIPRIIFINKLDRENSNFFNAYEQAQQVFGSSVLTTQLPIGKESGFRGIIDVLEQKAYIYGNAHDGKFQVEDVPADMQADAQSHREKLVERIVEADDELMMRYLDGEEIGLPELKAIMMKAVHSGKVVPVACGSATANMGIMQLMDLLAAVAPSPLQAPQEKSIAPDANGPLEALVFKTVADPYGKLSYLKVISGTLKSDTHVWNINKAHDERIGQLQIIRGKEQQPITELVAGDLGVIVKLIDTTTGDTLTTPDKGVQLDGVEFPEPLFQAAAKPKTKADLEKLGAALSRLIEEDPTIHVSRDPETGETIVSGMGESHIQVCIERMHRKSGVDVTVDLPRIPYRETVQTSAKAEYKHKKQTGGHGQYGHVHLEIKPCDAEFEFTESVVGGVVPRNFIPAVEKGVREVLAEGLLAGFPVVNIHVNLFDGSYHPVDSSEMAFKIAAGQAFKKAALAAKPVIMEPVVDLKITVPDTNMGDVMGDIGSNRRGRVLGMEPLGNGFTVIEAQAPLAEVQRYATDLRSQTQGRGIFVMSMSHYEAVPALVAEKIIEAAKQNEPVAAHH